MYISVNGNIDMRMCCLFSRALLSKVIQMSFGRYISDLHRMSRDKDTIVISAHKKLEHNPTLGLHYTLPFRRLSGSGDLPKGCVK